MFRGKLRPTSVMYDSSILWQADRELKNSRRRPAAREAAFGGATSGRIDPPIEVVGLVVICGRSGLP